MILRTVSPKRPSGFGALEQPDTLLETKERQKGRKVGHGYTVIQRYYAILNSDLDETAPLRWYRGS